MQHAEIPIESPITRRSRIFPKKPSGKFHRARLIVAFFLFSGFFLIPFIKINGHPFLLMNFVERKFIILGQIFWPQDTHLLIFLLLIFFVFVILFTVVFGRVWCGWACPQTLFMEMIFRKIEYLIEGNAGQQRKLSEQKWTNEKFFKRTIKHLLFVLISLTVSFVVLSYVVGIEKTILWLSMKAAMPSFALLFVFAFALIFYFVFSVLREYACTVVCPYGRLQGVLVNKDSIVVAYDRFRGEPRGKIDKKSPTNHGDCVDCSLCVQVCPTGIDIRNGTQMECVHCTACIDACDEVMAKIGKPKGLIRLDSIQGLLGRKRFQLNARMIAYSFVLMLLMSGFFYLILSRTDTETTLVRAIGQLYQELPNGNISNLYSIQVINKTFTPITVQFRIKNHSGQITRPDKIDISGQSIAQDVLLIEIPSGDIRQMKTPLQIEIIQNGRVIETVSTNFLAPVSKL
ncbi:MAG: cytochrome c oxidase accessory protein CcoG [Candidatus Competibacteraceae bacterium]|nr:cytochrome c oxidase accessory protein CcoG [Candidatus Competibacteraceae bacterium]